MFIKKCLWDDKCFVCCNHCKYMVRYPSVGELEYYNCAFHNYIDIDPIDFCEDFYCFFADKTKEEMQELGIIK